MRDSCMHAQNTVFQRCSVTAAAMLAHMEGLLADPCAPAATSPRGCFLSAVFLLLQQVHAWWFWKL